MQYTLYLRHVSVKDDGATDRLAELVVLPFRDQFVQVLLLGGVSQQPRAVLKHCMHIKYPREWAQNN